MSAIFRQLTTGIKFDKKKYRQDAEKFGLLKKQSNEETKDENLENDFNLESDIVPDSNLPTPEESDVEDSDVRIFGKICYYF